MNNIPPFYTFLFVVLLIIVFCLIYNMVYILRKNKRNVDQLKYLLSHDPITGHTNWDWLWKQLNHATATKDIPYDFAHFDIKSFRLFNELYNHTTGDEILKFVSKKLYEQDFIMYSARCHNDNFAFVTNPDKVYNLKEQINKMFSDMKYMPGLEEYPIYYRCGVVEKNQTLRSNDSVADMAKNAQQRGRKLNCTEVIFYDESIMDIVLQGEKYKLELPEAIMRDEILVYLQPKISTSSEELYGAEALVRWMYHGKKLMFPGDFVPHLENNNAIGMLDEHVIEKVCQYLEKWKNEGRKLCQISINLSQKEIYKASLVDDILTVVNKYDVDRHLIEFELTESAFYEDQDYMLNVMYLLRKEGFGLSMDDFGTGYSSFSLLKDMPLTTLKIDKKFIDSVGKEDDTKGEMIVEDLVNMVKHLQLTSVAEGVEDAKQKETLRKWGCDYIQGYYYSKPIPVEDFEAKYL